MRPLITAQGFESDTTPFTNTGTNARTSTTPITGSWSLQGGGGLAADGASIYTLPTASRPSTGSRKALRLDIRFNFKRASATPTGGTLEVFVIGAALIDHRLQMATATNVLKMYGVSGATDLSTTAHAIRIDYREEKSAGVYVRVYVDGALEITYRGTAFGQIGTLAYLWALVVSAAGKCTWNAWLDDLTVNASWDPQ